MEKGTASAKMAVEAMGDNYDEVQFQRDLEAMYAADWFAQYRDEYILQKLGKGDLLVKAAAARLASAGTLLPAGAPSGLTTPGTGVAAQTPQQQLQPGAPAGAPMGNTQQGGSPPDMGNAGNSPNAGSSPGLVVPERSAGG